MKVFFVTIGFVLTIFSFAQINLEYQKPHADILKIADVNLPPFTYVDDAGEKAVMIYRNQYKTIAEMSEQEVRLGGLRINPKTNIGSRTRFYPKLTFYDLKKKEEKNFKGLPNNLKASNFSLSPKQELLSFLHTTASGSELWIVDLNTLNAKKLTSANINANMSSVYEWFPDSKNLLVKMLPNSRKELINTKLSIPTGPTISESDGTIAQNRTYQDLLKNKNDEQNFETLTTSIIKKVGLDGSITDWKSEGMFRGINVSPNGEYVLITEIKKPFSYLVPYYRFPYTVTIYDKNGKKIKTVLDAPLEEDRAKGFMSTKKGDRNVDWRADKPATIYWVKALDDGNAENEVEYRDEILTLDAPFSGKSKTILKTKDRFYDINWGNDEIAVASDYWWNNRNTRNYVFNPSNSAEVEEVFSRNYQDRYNDPGTFITKRNAAGISVLDIEGNKLFLEGEGVSEDGILPFIDEFDVKTLKTKRLWRAEKGNQLETISSVINSKKGIILERIESPKDYPNYFFRNIKTKELEQVTFFENPFKAIQDAEKRVIKYKRDDGLDLSATLYLPPGYNKKDKLPMVMWAYPREFKDKSSAEQVTSSSNEFIYPYYGSPVYWLLRGYIVLDDAAFPIIGEGKEEPNDSFIKQLVANAKAGIDAVDELGYLDRERVAVGGHSYGAFMTANLLTHSDLFAAGIARSGAYNRTLTPFGFQSEERNYWEAPEVYNTMSPFMNAHKMKHPLLLIHGEEDNNSGTYPMQSERYFNALKGLGATTRLVILPKESHGYSSKESILHLLWEQDQWLEKYVKNKEK